MNTQQQQIQQVNQLPTQNKFIGKKIENTLSFNISSQVQNAQPQPFNMQQNIVQQFQIGQAIPLSFALPSKKVPQKIQNNSVTITLGQNEKQKQKQKASQQGNGVVQQQFSQQNLKSLIQEQKKFKKEDQLIQVDGNLRGQQPMSLQERRQQKKMEQIQQDNALIKKDISIIQQATNISNLSSDCEEFVDIMMPKKNRLSHLQVQQNYSLPQQVQYSNNNNNNNDQNNQEKDQKKQIDIDEIVKKSNMKYKTDKEMIEIQKLQKQNEILKLKEKLKKQEEEIRKRNSQKTQKFKEKKKLKEKEQQQLKKEQQMQQEQQQKRRKSISKVNKSSHSTSTQNISQQNTSRENISIQKPEISKEQFDQATRNRVKELMRKQKEEKERQEEEKEKKKLKLEILRQEQLIQLQKSKIKTIEQEEEERRAQVIKRPGGGGQVIAQNQQDKRDSRQSLYQREQLENMQDQSDYPYQEEFENDQQEQQQQQYQYEQRDKSLKSRKPVIPQQKHTPSKKNRPLSSAGIKKQNQNQPPVEDMVSESFLQENIRASIKQLYPECTLEELIQLEEEYRKEFIKETKKTKQLNNFKPKQNLNLNRPKSATGLKKNINQRSDFEKIKAKQLKEYNQELQSLLELKKFEDFDVDSVKNPIQMIEQLKDLAKQIEDDIEMNDRKFGVGKYKRAKVENNAINSDSKMPQNNKMQEEIAKLEKEAYIKELYLNAQNEFSAEEMQEFELYLQTHMVDGDIVLTSDEEGNEENEQDDYNQDDEDDDNQEEDNEEEGEDQEQDKKEQYQNIRQIQQQPKLYIPNTKKVSQQQSQTRGLQNNIQHSKSVQDMNNSYVSMQRGRSQDHRTPKSCLIKEQKQKRSKTVTFDQEFVQSEQKTHLQTSPSIRQQKEKYDFNEFDDFNERDIEGSAIMAAEYKAQMDKNKENNSLIMNKQQGNELKQKQTNQIKEEEEQRKKFEKKINDVKELIQQYSGEKKRSIDISQPMSSLESSASSNLRLSHLKSQNVPSSFVQNDTPKTNNPYGLQQQTQKQKVQTQTQPPKQLDQLLNKQKQNIGNNQQFETQVVAQKNIVPSMKNSNKSIPAKENTNTLNIPPLQPQNNLSNKNNKQFLKEAQPSPILITQSSPQALSNIPSEFDCDFLNFNEQFDIDQFKSQLSQEDLKQLIHVNNLDLKQFFTNEKLNSVQRINGQGLGKGGNNEKKYTYDEEDEGLFADDSPKNNEKMNEEAQQSEQAFNYYEKNKELMQSNEKNNTQKYNNFMIQQNNNSQTQQSNQINQNEYYSNYSDYNKEFLDDDKLFALSATDLLKLAQTNTKIPK